MKKEGLRRRNAWMHECLDALVKYMQSGTSYSSTSTSFVSPGINPNSRANSRLH
jgi:hypothetical protein